MGSEVVQAPSQADISGSDKTKRSRGLSDQVQVRDAVQHALEGSAARPAKRTRQSKRSLHVGITPDQRTGTHQKKKHSAAGQGALYVEHGSKETGPTAPVTPEYRLRSRQGRIRQKSCAK